jgi:hypothetical protein
LTSEVLDNLTRLYRNAEEHLRQSYRASYQELIAYMRRLYDGKLVEFER